MEHKVIQRNIPPERENTNDRFRVRYNDKSKFDFLKVNIKRMSDASIQSFYFKSKDLPNFDSIHFSCSIKSNKLHVEWTDATPLSNKWKVYTQTEIESLLIKAVKKLQKNDAIFLDEKFNINERSVTHRLGMYLAELFPNEDVDCEYNRTYNEDADEYIAKNVELQIIENGLTLKDVEAKTVFPDIIIHKRNESRNLLAIEVKMKWKSRKSDFDLIKAEAYKRRLSYDYSVFLIIGPENYVDIKWIK